jgi:hypothetical protein
VNPLYRDVMITLVGLAVFSLVVLLAVAWWPRPRARVFTIPEVPPLVTALRDVNGRVWLREGDTQLWCSGPTKRYTAELIELCGPLTEVKP